MNLEDKVIEASNGEKYLVIKEIDLEGKTACFLTNINNQLDSFFAEVTDNTIDKIESVELKEKLLEIIAKED